MKYSFVYILMCSDDSYYTRITNDPNRRLNEHQAGVPGSYTYSRRPVELVFLAKFTEPSMAIKFEKQVKGWSRKKKEALIQRNWDRLKELSECKNETSHTH